MPLSTITPITLQGQPRGLSSFIRSGVVYVAWSDEVGSGVGALRRIRWKPHNSANFTEVIPSLVHIFQNFTTIYNLTTDSVVAVWDDGLSRPSENGSIYVARFNAVTGALLSGPTVLAKGMGPKLCYRTTGTDELLLYFSTPKTFGVYGSTSSDGGITWRSGEPLVTGQVNGTTRVAVAAYDDTHVSVAQLGTDTKSMPEIGQYSRTRPLRSIVKHPSTAGQFYVAEPSKFDNTTLTDNLRGALTLNAGGTEVLHLSGVQQGTSDTVNAVSLLSVVGTAVTNLGSVGPVGGVLGHNLVSYTLNLAPGSVAVVLPGASSYAVDMGVSAAYAYIAEYSDSTTNGQFVVVKLSDGTNATILSSITGVRAIAVANFPGTPLIFVATTESGVERLRVYQENALTPTLLLNVKLPSRVNNMSVTAGTAPSTARVYISMVDRFGSYDYYNASFPILLTDTFKFAGGGQFFKSTIAASGNVFVAAGNMGVIAFSAVGRVLAQTRASGEVIPAWKANTSYTTGNLTAPRTSHPFSPNRFYFKCTTGGTSGSSEPSWSTTLTATDNTVVWTPQAVTDGVVTDLVLDPTTHHLYAVGSAGGNLGTDGRVWILDVGGLI